MSKKTFFVGVKAIITKDDTVLLLKKRQGDRVFWDAPGGCINEGEAIDKAFTRELREELPSLEAFTRGELLHAEVLTRDIKDTTSLTLLFYHTEAKFNGRVVLSEEHTEYRYVPFAEACEIGSEGIPEAISRLQR